ncbi:hypothetical protein [Pseudomonas cerasi]
MKKDTAEEINGICDNAAEQAVHSSVSGVNSQSSDKRIALYVTQLNGTLFGFVAMPGQTN